MYLKFQYKTGITVTYFPSLVLPLLLKEKARYFLAAFLAIIDAISFYILCSDTKRKHV